MNITQKKQKVYDLYHGKRNTDDMGYVDQFMKGIGVFEVFFDKIEIPSSTNTETEPQEFELYLKQMFHRDDSKNYIVSKHITKARLSRMNTKAKPGINNKLLSKETLCGIEVQNFEVRGRKPKFIPCILLYMMLVDQPKCGVHLEKIWKISKSTF
jgi:hypothetical protein